jgi:hypothetical protein
MMLTMLACRSPEVFQGWNNIHFGAKAENYIVLPIIPN